MRDAQGDYELMIHGALTAAGKVEKFQEKMIIKPGQENKLEKLILAKPPADLLLTFIGEGSLLGSQRFELG